MYAFIMTAAGFSCQSQQPFAQAKKNPPTLLCADGFFA
jgi:hypothetical protein